MKKNIFKSNGFQSLLASLLCIVLGLFLGYLVLLVINPAGAGEAILTVVKNFLTYKKTSSQLKYLGNTLVKTAPLLMCSLSILFAYKVGLFNIGAAGQYCFGVALSLYAALGLGWSWLPCLLVAMAGGAVIPAKTESTMQTSSAQSQKRCLVAFIKYSPHHFSAARAYRAAVVCRQYSTKPACWEREIAFRALVPVRGGRKCANAVVYDCKNVLQRGGGVCSMRARTAAARKRLCWAYRGSKTPLHSVIRQIPQTTVAAGRVLRYNQTNLCLSA